eukprot:scaffold84409_cov48-Phaeocystis_antarctica.AAC.1
MPCDDDCARATCGCELALSADRETHGLRGVGSWRTVGEQHAQNLRRIHRWSSIPALPDSR